METQGVRQKALKEAEYTRQDSCSVTLKAFSFITEKWPEHLNTFIFSYVLAALMLLCQPVVFNVLQGKVKPIASEPSHLNLHKQSL